MYVFNPAMYRLHPQRWKILPKTLRKQLKYILRNINRQVSEVGVLFKQDAKQKLRFRAIPCPEFNNIKRRIIGGKMLSHQQRLILQYFRLTTGEVILRKLHNFTKQFVTFLVVK